MNYVNYVKHSLYTPDSYHRRFDLDLPNKDTEPYWENQAKRLALVALPFISLYRPAGTILSIGMGSWRAVSHLSTALASEGEREWKEVSLELLQTALAVLSVASSVFNFTLGLAITTAIETLQGFASSCHALYRGEYRRAAEEALQTLASAVYLGFMVSGALEAMLFFSLLQTTVSFIQAQNDFAQGKYLEAAAKIGMGFVRLHQTKGYVQQIERRERLFAMQKYAAFLTRALKGREVRYLLENPLSYFKNAETAILDDVDFGAYFHGYGKALVKGANLAFRMKVVDGKEITELDFKVNHVFREKIQGIIDECSKLNSHEIKEILELSQSHAKGIQIKENQPLPIGKTTQRMTTKITFEGLGSIWIGSSKDLPTMYDRIIVQMDADKNLYDFHELMAFLDIDQALNVSTQEDLDRLKMGHLFRIFFPREATPFERTEEFFDLPLDQLKMKMIEKAPAMQSIFEDYFDRMTPEKILLGKMRYRVNGLAEKAYEQGARGLTASITGAYSEEILFQRIASMLKMGMLSSELRAQGNLYVHGMSISADFHSGGADSVFTQMITETDCREGMQFNQLYYHGKARFLISLDALETGTYQYFYDSYGNRHIDGHYWGNSYRSRPGILEFVDGLQNVQKPNHMWWYHPYGGHEVMLKERIDPSFFTGIAVNNAKMQADLMDYLRSHELVQKDRSGQETILGIAADRFIQVAKSASEELFTT